MKVLCITSYDDYKHSEGPTAIVLMKDGETEDQVFLEWYRKENPDDEDKSDEWCMEETMYSWNIREVTER